MSHWQRWLRLGGACGLAVVVYFVVPASPRLPASAIVLRSLAAVGALVLLALGVVWQLRRSMEHGFDHRIDGLVVFLVIVVMAFSLGFYLMSAQNPDQLEGVSTRVDALYFTMSTLTTVGYGDAYAKGQAARVLVVVQMVFNLVLVATAAAVLSARIRAAATKRIQDRASRRQAGGPTEEG
jgi:voltage-gated potassium channel